MRTNKDDYSALVYAIQDGDEKQVRNLLEELQDRLIDYLTIRFRAEEMVAQDCVQQVFEEAIYQIRDDNIRTPQSIFSYLLQSCRYEYYKYHRNDTRFEPPEEAFDDMAAPADQQEELLDEERQLILEECLEELNERDYDFIEYVIDKPEASTVDLSEQFDLTEGYARTLKYRIVQKLNECVGRKFEI